MTDDMRSLLRSSVGFAATGALTRLHIANAAVTTATVWWVQGFAEQEDVSFKKLVADYEKAREYARLCDHTLRPEPPEDRLGNHQRRGPRPVPKQPLRT
jgi:hypothetical protein